ncbi:ParB N-terminal domain-containing protein [Deinococcus sedimenti]|uniref:Chromosome 2-partitioning protein ParB n=1 Tax=Deinococcus sedimenti TaxID=1867090 RepID=A0ABQ2SB24_9DEIO|nr:ParB/RepB/Spo0J family partition protein [Deinococcus sedimenti]GGS03904.1 putative chromosome 2-partitioning protein ParB [Deinococcus sedimenti]
MTRRPRPERRRDLAGLIGADAPDLTRRNLPDTHLPVTVLTPGPSQPRRAFDAGSLDSLARSIREHGVLQPLLVRPAGNQYEIVAGERRWRAAQLADLTEVPVVIRDIGDTEARQIALIENLQRDDLNTLDEVDAKLELVATTLNVPLQDARGRLMQLLREEPGADHAALEQLFAALGEQWTSFARNKLKILNWPAPLLAAVRQGLAYTAAQLIAQADPAQHERLITLARSGATRSELRDAIQQGKARPAAPAPAQEVVRQMGRTQWLNSLTADETRDLDRWLARMPASLRAKLKS